MTPAVLPFGKFTLDPRQLSVEVETLGQAPDFSALRTGLFVAMNSPQGGLKVYVPPPPPPPPPKEPPPTPAIKLPKAA